MCRLSVHFTRKDARQFVACSCQCLRARGPVQRHHLSLARRALTHTACPFLPLSPARLSLRSHRHGFSAQTSRFIHEARASGQGCLVHCFAGVSRSASVIMAYLIDTEVRPTCSPLHFAANSSPVLFG